MIYRGGGSTKSTSPKNTKTSGTIYKVANLDFNYHMFNDGYLTMAIQ